MEKAPSLGASRKPVARAKERTLGKAHLRRVRQSLVPKLPLENRCACAVPSQVTEQKTVQLALLTARSASRAVQDGGAASVLGSRKAICNYIEYMRNKGINVEIDVDVFNCERGFRYGNSQGEVTTLCCMLPTFIGGKKQKILCYVIKGDAPLLIGRPLMKKLNMVIDYYAADLYLSGENQWKPLDLGPKGEHIIHLMEDYDTLRAPDPHAC